MGCNYPLTAYRAADGTVVFESNRTDTLHVLNLPCGRCMGCRVQLALEWRTRLVHEASLWPQNCFITLTYDDDNLPPGGGLRYEDFQAFMKRLRSRLAGKKTIRFYATGEYGERLRRPHYHAAIFNHDFSEDRTELRRSGAGYVLFNSPLLNACWAKGFANIGEFNRQTAGYLARYVTKKITGEDHGRIDRETGEVRPPELAHMSTHPGIGAGWLHKWKQDVYPFDRVIVDGQPRTPPRYYFRLLRSLDRTQAAEVKDKKQLTLERRKKDDTPQRQRAKEEVIRARVKRLKRTL